MSNLYRFGFPYVYPLKKENKLVNCFFNSEIFYSFVIKITMLSQCKNIARIRLKSFKFTHATNIDLQNITLAIFQKLDYLTRKNAK